MYNRRSGRLVFGELVKWIRDNIDRGDHAAFRVVQLRERDLHEVEEFAFKRNLI
jgi:hypothetical protein